MELRSFFLDYGTLEILSLGKEEGEKLPISQDREFSNWLLHTRDSLFLFYTQLSPQIPLRKESIFCLEQVHGKKIYSTGQIREFQSLNSRLYPEGDGLYTQEEGVVLGIRTADCVPLFIWDWKNPWIAVLHIGWRGAKLGILQEFLGLISQRNSEYGFYIGPCIRGDHYEVGEEVAEFFLDWEGVVKQKPSLDSSVFLLDLPSFVKKVISVWRPGSLVWDSEEDTYRSKKWYSHRCGEAGRNLHGIRFFAFSVSQLKGSWNQP